MAVAANMSKPQRRGRPTGAEAIEKRKGILAAATQAFLSQGYQNVSMREVAVRADVSTRTLYNLYEDKATLFNACLDSISLDVRGPMRLEGASFAEALETFASDMVRTLSREDSIGFARLVMNDGRDIPELAAAGFVNQERQFLKPLVAYLNDHALAEPEALAKMFIALAISEWNRSITFHLPLAGDAEISRHAARATALFVKGLDGFRPGG